MTSTCAFSARAQKEMRAIAKSGGAGVQVSDETLNTNRLRALAESCPPARNVRGGSVPHVVYLAARCQCGAAYFGMACPMCTQQTLVANGSFVDDYLAIQFAAFSAVAPGVEKTGQLLERESSS